MTGMLFLALFVPELLKTQQDEKERQIADLKSRIQVVEGEFVLIVQVYFLLEHSAFLNLK